MAESLRNCVDSQNEPPKDKAGDDCQVVAEELKVKEEPVSDSDERTLEPNGAALQWPDVNIKEEAGETGHFQLEDDGHSEQAGPSGSRDSESVKLGKREAVEYLRKLEALCALDCLPGGAPCSNEDDDADEGVNGDLAVNKVAWGPFVPNSCTEDHPCPRDDSGEARDANHDIGGKVTEDGKAPGLLTTCERDKRSTNADNRKTRDSDHRSDAGEGAVNDMAFGFPALKSCTGGGSYACDLCNFQCSTDAELNYHKRAHTGETPYVCGLCDFSCFDIADLRAHLKSHFGRLKAYSCTFCDFRANYKAELKHHLKTHTGEKPFACGLCDYRCSQSNRLKIHMTKHTGERPFACDRCDYKCTIRYRLAQHMKKHTGEKPYTCTMCPYRCSDQSALKVHVRLHTGDKPYVCDICGYSCAQSTRLREHKMTHARETKDTKEKRFGCDMCTFRCNDRSNLNAHKKRHFERIFFCHMCEYRCTKTAELRVHMRIHSGEKPYACELCDYRSAFVNNLNRHKRTHEKPGPCVKLSMEGVCSMQPNGPTVMSADATTVDLACTNSQMHVDNP